MEVPPGKEVIELDRKAVLEICLDWIEKNKTEYAEIVSKAIVPPLTEEQLEIARISIQVSQVMLIRMVPMLIAEVVANLPSCDQPNQQ